VEEEENDDSQRIRGQWVRVGEEITNLLMMARLMVAVYGRNRVITTGMKGMAT